MPTKFKSSPKTLDLGQLGVIKALDLTAHGYEDPTCTYIGGIEYASPPTGQNRFRPPQPLPAGFKYGSKSKPGSYVGQTGVSPQLPTSRAASSESWDEDCLQSNIWIPSGSRPQGGWPILFFIHGGWLQTGNANMAPTIVANLMHETPFTAIVVMPSYRLNLFGFLAGPELEAEARRRGDTVGNMGLWDQRMALEWVHRNARAIGGDSSRITVSGYSAGSYSTFQQLAHDLDRPKKEQLISRVIMFSNGPGVKPKGIAEHGKQFNELLGRLGIGLGLPAEEKLRRLRGLDIDTLVKVQAKMTLTEFRVLSDGDFISSTLYQSVNDGSFARKCKARGIKILNGECSQEWFVYANWRPSKSAGYDALFTRLTADYPEATVAKLMPLYFSNKDLPAQFKDWQDAAGRIFADIQVYAMERGFADKLDKNGFKAGEDLFRYRIEMRAKCVQVPKEWGVTHGTDYAIWFWGNGQGSGLSQEEEKMFGPLNKVFADFVGHKDMKWPEQGVRTQLRLDPHGCTGMAEDRMWERGVTIWDALTTEDPKAKL